MAKQLVVKVVANQGHDTEIDVPPFVLPLTDDDAVTVAAFAAILDKVDSTPHDGVVAVQETVKTCLPVIRLFGTAIRAKIAVPVLVTLDVEDATEDSPV
jgi:hypothetical protein